MGDGRTFGTDSGVGSTRALIEARLPAVREQRQRLEDELAAVIAQENAMVSVLEGLAALADAPLGEGKGSQAAAPVQSAGEVPAAADEPAEPVEAAGPVGSAADEQAPVPAAVPAKKAVKKEAVKKAAAKKAAPRKDAAGKGGAAKKSAAGPSADRDAEQAPVAAAKKTAPRSAAKAPAKTATPAAARKSTRAKTAPAAADQAAAQPPKGRRRLTDADSVLTVLRQAEEPLRARDVTGRLGLADTNGAVDAVRTMLERLAKASQAKRTGRGLYAVAD